MTQDTRSQVAAENDRMLQESVPIPRTLVRFKKTDLVKVHADREQAERQAIAKQRNANYLLPVVEIATPQPPREAD